MTHYVFVKDANRIYIEVDGRRELLPFSDPDGLAIARRLSSRRRKQKLVVEYINSAPTEEEIAHYRSIFAPVICQRASGRPSLRFPLRVVQLGVTPQATETKIDSEHLTGKTDDDIGRMITKMRNEKTLKLIVPDLRVYRKLRKHLRSDDVLSFNEGWSSKNEQSEKDLASFDFSGSEYVADTACPKGIRVFSRFEPLISKEIVIVTIEEPGLDMDMFGYYPGGIRPAMGIIWTKYNEKFSPYQAYSTAGHESFHFGLHYRDFFTDDVVSGQEGIIRLTEVMFRLMCNALNRTDGKHYPVNFPREEFRERKLISQYDYTLLARILARIASESGTDEKVEIENKAAADQWFQEHRKEVEP